MAVVKINAIEVPDESAAELEKRFAQRHGSTDKTPGFLGFELLRPTKGDNRYFVYTKWESEEHFQQWMREHHENAHANEQGPVSTGSSLLEFEVVLSSENGQ